MIHGITKKDWNDYVEGLANETTRDRIEAHLIGCLGCWELYDQMAHATETLRATGQGIRAGSMLQDRELYAGLHGVYEKLRMAETVQPASAVALHLAIQRKLEELAAVMTPMCGSNTAIKALQAAANGSPARSLDQVTVDNWTPFLKSLNAIASVMCGDTGAHLVWESGQF